MPMRNLFSQLVILALLLAQPAPPDFSATWDGPGAAELRWSGSASLTCLYKGRTLIRCWQDLGDGPHVLVLGGRGPLDAKARPDFGDTFTLTQDNALSRAPLRWVVQLAMVRT